MRPDPSLAGLLRRVCPPGAGVGVSVALRGEDTEFPLELPSSWSEKRRREFVAGRFAARDALNELGMVGWVERAPDGLPLFPTPLSGSISHTGSREIWGVAVATRSAQSIGIDIEECKRLEPALFDHILTPQEKNKLRADEVDLGRAALQVFSAKEAFYKCVFPVRREFFGFQDAIVNWHAPPGSGPHDGAPFIQLDFEVLSLRDGMRLPGQMMLTHHHLFCCCVWS